ncbi:MAG: DUF342 domain-containing protein, partial [SAR324 cluster bacterium]|nr:DUF342 domain-containing protein [SAR324 cluster bacterium]
LDRSIVVKPSYDEKGIQYLIATTYGFLVREKERLRVLPALTIKSDVDLTSGNIEVKGKVEISGDVAKGFKVHARDDIAIRGRTHGSILSSQCGSIKVDQLVLGGPGLFASAGQSFTAQMIQNLKVKAEGDVMILKDARDSEISANGCLLMKEGHLFGGQAIVLGGIEARIVGSEGGTPTIVGSRSKAEVEEEAKQLAIQIEENKKLCETMGAKLGPVIKPDVEKIPVLELAHCKKINDVLSKLDDMKAECEVMERRLAKLQDALEREPWFQLNYGSLLHKGVTIKVGEDQFYLDNYKTGPGTIEYSAEKRSFSEVKYKELRALRPKKKVDPNSPGPV